MRGNNKRFDVGILGVWYGLNYGSSLTYYALQSTIKEIGLSPLMIEKPGNDPNDPERQNTHARRFANENFYTSDVYPLSEQNKLNNLCDGFVIGSDQVWNYGISKGFGKTFYLDFAEDNKTKIAYAASFGHAIDFAPQEEREVISRLMKRFDAISVREDDGVRLCRDVYHVNATRVLDPVFIVNPEKFDDLAGHSKIKESGPYLLAYILDATPEKKQLLLHMSHRLGLRPVIMLDGFSNNAAINRKTLDMDDCIRSNLEVYDWVSLFRNASYVLTDSFHGMCFSILFEKQFLPLPNKRRGYSRFNSIANLLNVSDRLISDPQKEISEENFMKHIDYKKINAILTSERTRCRNWLSAALGNLGGRKANNSGKAIQNNISIELENQKKANILHSKPDFIKIKILAALLRDYGIKHIVMSPGGRDVPIVRMFENNEEIFTLHQVVDERSAGYYALGIAAQTGKPVACVCTSGTAASNYLPAVTEAYYTGIPIIFITADRKQVYLNHGEDQTIPQTHIYDGVIKKSITLPEGAEFRDFYQTRRDISDAILESTHNTFGPVHINMAIDDIGIGADLPSQYWSLNNIQPKRVEPHILRASAQDGTKAIMRWVNALSRSKKILLVYGQNQPRTKDQNIFIESFASKFNCVILTDHISNLSNSYTLKPYNMLRAITQKDFDDNLSPDILLTVGGKQLMNDPLTQKIRRGKPNIRHWSVTPDGKIKDFYFRLTSVLEMSQDYFFEFFSTNAGNIKNDNSYYNIWKKYNDRYPSPSFEKLHANYVQSKFLPNIPENSILHLGVGQSFYDSRKYYIKPSVHVFCNMGTNGIDGCTSTFMGQSAVTRDKLCFLLVGDLSFFYDMNSIWKKRLTPNMRILLVNNNGTDLLRGNKLHNVTSMHNTIAEQWVKSVGFHYLSARTKEEFDRNLAVFLNRESDSPIFFEVLYNF